MSNSCDLLHNVYIINIDVQICKLTVTVIVVCRLETAHTRLS